MSTSARRVLVFAGLVLAAVAIAAHAQTYECTQVVLQPGLATAYWSPQCLTTDLCDPGEGCRLQLQMPDALIVGSVQSTAYQVPVAPLHCPFPEYPYCVPQWAAIDIWMTDNTYLGFVGEFDGPLATVGGHWEATGDFDLRDELFSAGFDY